MTLPDLSELACVNRMLLMIGESPVTSIEDTSFSSATIAHDLLLQESLLLQTRGAHYNTFYVDLEPDVSGFLYKPADALRLLPVDRSSHVALLGNRLFNTQDNTYVFTSAVTCELVMFQAWDQLPPVVRQYLQIKAARILATRVDADRVKMMFSQQEELDAKSAMMADESAHGTGSVFDNRTSQESLSRSSNPSRTGGPW